LPPDGAAVFMTAARVSELCHYVSTTGGPTGAEVDSTLDIWRQQGEAPGISDWNNVDTDGDGRLNSEDRFDDNPNRY
jgi:hypothetical protein